MTEWIYGIGNVLIYFIAAVAVVLSARMLVRIYDELFRKILHFVLLGSLLVWTISFPTWWRAVLTAVGFVVVVYPILWFFERFRSYSQVTTERRKGELKNSLVVVFAMFALVLTITEGVFHDRYLALASVYAWGVGDAFAALVGKRYGRHKLRGPGLSGEKSLEGTLTMAGCAFVSVLTVLLVRGGIGVGAAVLTAAVTAVVAAVCELYTKNGYDTITCPLASMGTLLGMLAAVGGL